MVSLAVLGRFAPEGGGRRCLMPVREVSRLRCRPRASGGPQGQRINLHGPVGANVSWLITRKDSQFINHKLNCPECIETICRNRRSDDHPLSSQNAAFRRGLIYRHDLMREPWVRRAIRARWRHDAGPPAAKSAPRSVTTAPTRRPRPTNPRLPRRGCPAGGGGTIAAAFHPPAPPGSATLPMRRRRPATPGGPSAPPGEDASAPTETVARAPPPSCTAPWAAGPAFSPQRSTPAMAQLIGAELEWLITSRRDHTEVEEVVAADEVGSEEGVAARPVRNRTPRTGRPLSRTGLPQWDR